VEILYTARYIDAAAFLRVYAIWYVLMAIPDDSAARAAGDSRWILKVTAVFSAITLAAVLWGARSGGAMGVLIAYLAVTFAQKAYSLDWVSRRLGASLTALFPWRKVTAFACAAGVCSMASFAARAGFVSERAWFLACAPLFAAAYLLVGLYIRSLTAREAFSGPPRVLMILPGLSVGGLEMMVLGLSRELKARGLAEPSVLSFEAETGALRPAFEKAGIALRGFAKGRGFSFRLPFLIASLARRGEIGVLHTHDLGALIYGVFAKGLSGGSLRLVHTQHSFVHLARKSRHLWYERFFSRCADVLCAVSEDLVATYETRVGLPSGRVRLVPNGVFFPSEPASESRAGAREAVLVTIATSLSTSTLALAPRCDSLWLLSLARIAPGKGQDVLIRVWNSLSTEERSGAVLVLVGPESHPGFVAELSAKAGEDVIFVGPTLQSSLWYDAADAYVSGSRYEGMPLGPLEAIGRGLPALLSNIPGHRVFEGSARLFALDHEAQSTAELGAFLRELKRGSFATRKSRWESVRALRERSGIEAMARAYAAFYR
jgi:glycosyltransferase involved in cell wall biosynthesis